jgi:hypothetical protein
MFSLILIAFLNNGAHYRGSGNGAKRKIPLSSRLEMAKMIWGWRGEVERRGWL